MTSFIITGSMYLTVVFLACLLQYYIPASIAIGFRKSNVIEIEAIFGHFS